MKKVEFYLNVFHYCIYKWHFRSHLFANKINPLRLIHKLPFQKKRYEKLGIDIDREVDKIFSDERFGISSAVSAAVLIIFLFFLLLAMTNGARLILRYNRSDTSVYYYLLLGSIALFITYIFVLKKDKYLFYFQSFKRWSRSQKTRYHILTLLVLSTIGFLYIVSLYLKIKFVN